MLLLFNNDFESLQHLHQYGKSYRVTASPTTPNNKKKSTNNQKTTNNNNNQKTTNKNTKQKKKCSITTATYRCGLIYRFKTQYRNTFQCL